MPQTAIEKIVQAHSLGRKAEQVVRAGDMLTVRPRHVLTHDNTGAVLPKFLTIGASRVADPDQPVFALDHNVQDTSDSNLAKYARIEAFAAEQGIVFHPARAGIGHQLMMENGFVHPGSLVVASDSHANMYGALAALGTPVVRTDAAAIWATGTTWWQVPRTVKLWLDGTLAPGVTGKDLILTLCGMYAAGEVLNAALEFHGPGVATLSMADRMTVANMTTEWGALAGWFPFDELTAAYLRQRAAVLAARGLGHRLNEAMIRAWEASPPAPDPDAEYAAEIAVDLGRVSPHVAGPDSVSLIRPLAEVQADRITIHKAYLLSCVNSREQDLEAAAEVLRSRRVAPGVELYVAAASLEVQQHAEASGAWQIFRDAGATLLPPGCGACIGLGVGLLEDGEVGISATNRNFKGRMGSRNAQAYLASPVVVARSAAAGFISGEETTATGRPEYQFQRNPVASAGRSVEILDGFGADARGRALLLPCDNLNTDGIYGKDVTYRDDLSPEEMAGHAMRNYDPAFQSIVHDGDIIVSGRNFGTGSSREQAATALKYRGVRMVIAASFSQTYLRNAFNNAFICLESDSLYDAMTEQLQQRIAAGDKSIPADELQVDFAAATVSWRGQRYPTSPIGPAAQELILAGGLEALTRARLQA